MEPGAMIKLSITTDPQRRYRTDWRGRVILQIRPPLGNCDNLTVAEAQAGARHWRDAMASDITERMPQMIVGLQ